VVDATQPQPLSQSEDVAEAPPPAQRTLTQQSQTSLLTRGSVNSETTEEYDVLLSSSHSSDESELIARAPLIQEGQDESADGYLQEERRSEGPSNDDEAKDGEHLPVSDGAGANTN